MSEVRLNILDATRSVYGIVHVSIGDAVIASLSAEPETIEELEAALERFNKTAADQSHFATFIAGEEMQPWDSGIVIVDLAARMIAAESSYSYPQTEGEINYHDGVAATDVWLPYRLSPEWLVVSSILEYASLRDERLRQRRATPRCDIREVLYGRPLIEFVVREALDESERLDYAFVLSGDARSGYDSQQETIEETNRENNHSASSLPGADPEVNDIAGDDEPGRDNAVVRSLHIKWLMTPRADLVNRSPREAIVEKLDVIDSDLNSRELQWSLLNEGPPPLSGESIAYRFAGFGFHEYVIYYDLVRSLLNQCWDRIRQERPVANDDSTLDPSTAIDSVITGAELLLGGDSTRQSKRAVALERWLEEIKESWLNEPNEGFDGGTPGAIIEAERRRVPMVISAKDMIIDEDCELCRMLGGETGEDFGPGFWHLDGCNMDSDFAFSTHQTREEWESEELRRREFDLEFERQLAAERAGIDNSGGIDNADGIEDLETGKATRKSRVN